MRAFFASDDRPVEFLPEPRPSEREPFPAFAFPSEDRDLLRASPEPPPDAFPSEDRDLLRTSPEPPPDVLPLPRPLPRPLPPRRLLPPDDCFGFTRTIASWPPMPKKPRSAFCNTSMSAASGPSRPNSSTAAATALSTSLLRTSTHSTPATTFSSACCRASFSTLGGGAWARSPRGGLLARRPRSGSVELLACSSWLPSPLSLPSRRAFHQG